MDVVKNILGDSILGDRYSKNKNLVSCHKCGKQIDLDNIEEEKYVFMNNFRGVLCNNCGQNPKNY